MNNPIRTKEEQMIKNDLLKKYIQKENWNKVDLRLLKQALVEVSQQKLKDFFPIKKKVLFG